MRTMNSATRCTLAVILAAVGTGAGCSSVPQLALSDLPSTSGTGGNSSFPEEGGRGGGGTGFDASPVVTAAHAPPAVSGGTLLALQAGGRVVVSDTDRDRLLVVDVEKLSIVAETALGPGAEPGRLVEDAAGRVHAVLRGSGDVVSINAASGALLERRSVCRAPRGIAFDKSSDQLIVACLEGSLVELPAAGGPATRVTALGSDLRDVAFLGGSLVVTRFRSAELLFLDAARNVVRTTKLAGDGNGLDASVAWRAITAADGTLAISHQRSFRGRIELTPSAGGSSGTPAPHVDVDIGDSGANQGGSAGMAASGGTSGASAGTSSAAGTGGSPGTGGAAGSAGRAGSGGDAGANDGIALPGPSGYGSAFIPCSSVVEGTLTLAGSDGTMHVGPNLEGGVLPVDIAMNATHVAVAFAGAQTGMGSVGVYTRDQVLTAAPTDCVSTERFEPSPNVVAVAFDAKSGKLLLQRREPSELELVSLDDSTVNTLSLGGVSTFDTGHSMFHTDSGSGIACASCHPEGTDDGRVWSFSDVGARRTQPLDVGLAGTAPFHWDGELSDFGALMDRIFVERMGGPIESDERKNALEEYIYTLPRRPAARDASDPAAARGKLVFESAATGCSTCHSGPNFSNGDFGDIGKGPALQVPSLIAVSARAPYMHDGCASTLLARFDPTCGGSAHGDTSMLTSADLADLVAYLETL